MAEVFFQHPLMKSDLQISVKPDQVVWAYGLNTVSYPTYGGEVVQILSVYFDDMQISGTVGSVAEMEGIYAWFIAYMQYATQGVRSPSFNQQPVTFKYPERGWTFEIWPKTLPGFKYGRDVVAPTWSLTAAVKEPDQTFKQQVTNYAAFNASAQGKLTPFGKTTADFGKTGDLENNPFASPDAPDARKKGQDVKSYVSSQAKHLADSFSGFVQDYVNSDLTKLPQFQDISKAATGNPPSSHKKQTKGTATQRKVLGP